MYDVLFIVVVALAFRGRFEVCLFFDLRESVLEVYNAGTVHIYLGQLGRYRNLGWR